VGGDSDRRAPPGSERKEWGGGSGPRWLCGPEEEVGQGGKRKRGRRAVGLGREERERGLGVWRVLFFFPKLFKSFQTLNLNLFLNLFKLSKHFKASHQQTKTPCIQIMMHKHLLPLKLFKSDIKYFRAYFI
jgi:hypothetical protein